MSDDDAIWRLLSERRKDDGDSLDDEGITLRFRRESLVPVLDAALGVLAATRHLVEVTEDVLKEHRDRIAAGPEPDRRDDADVAGRDTGRRKINLSY